MRVPWGVGDEVEMHRCDARRDFAEKEDLEYSSLLLCSPDVTLKKLIKKGENGAEGARTDHEKPMA